MKTLFRITAIAVGNDGIVATVNDGWIRLWSIQDRGVVPTFPTRIDDYVQLDDERLAVLTRGEFQSRSCVQTSHLYCLGRAEAPGSAAQATGGA